MLVKGMGRGASPRTGTDELPGAAPAADERPGRLVRDREQVNLLALLPERRDPPHPSAVATQVLPCGASTWNRIGVRGALGSVMVARTSSAPLPQRPDPPMRRGTRRWQCMKITGRSRQSKFASYEG